MNRSLHLTLVAIAAWLLCRTCLAADPLYLQRPFDEITLDENNAGARLKVQPLKLPGRKLPDPADRKDELEIELLDRPGERYRVGWNSIAGVRFFEEMVLAEAQTLVKDEHFDEAYPYFQFLETRYPKTAGLKDAAENFLWVQIGNDFKSGRNDAALALLVELHQRNPQRQGLSAAFERVTTKLVAEQMAAENYRAARGLLRNLTQRFPDLAATAATYETQIRDQATARLNAAREALAAGKFRDAHQAARQALGIWPTIEKGRELAQEIHQKYPSVSVGVTSPLESTPRNVTRDWAARRTWRLLAVHLCERISAAAEGAGYRSVIGEVIVGKNPRQVEFRLRANGQAPDVARRLTPHDVARGLLAAADPRQSSFDPVWRDMLAAVAVGSGDDVSVELTRPPLRPEAWLQASVVAAGPYRIDAHTPLQTIFVRQSPGMDGGATPPSEVFEHAFVDSAAALRGLRRGELSVVDRISPWELKSLASSKEIAVGRYALPSVHVLVPNPRRPLAANRTLKRAIQYGIDRESILRRSLLDGQAIAGCECVSGPFPRGQAKDDPHGHAYDAGVAVRPYDPGLALALARIAAPDAKPTAPLTLAYPSDPTVRVACQSIVRQLDAVGISISPRELTPGESAGEDFDLVYLELPMQEPLVDVWRLLGPQGIAGPPSPAMLHALRELESVPDWFQATEKLHAIHRLAAAELPVIPLWQLVDHFAYHASVKGIGERPVTLYQNIDQWQVELRLPNE